MSAIEHIDQNFAITQVCSREKVAIYDVLKPPFSVHGLIQPTQQGESFRRMPKEIAEQVSQGVAQLHVHTAGGRIRFRTDSSYIAVKARLGDITKEPDCALTGFAGFDLYAGEKHIATFRPAFDIVQDLFDEVEMGPVGMREYTLNFPLYSQVTELYILLEEGASVSAAEPYPDKKPVVFYGSSITQGGCASRPGTCYTSILSRRLNFDYINLGFSGSAKAEQAMLEYIAGLDMSVFIYDYDHNAPNTAYLEATHEPFFRAFRKAHPRVPVICMNMPIPYKGGDEKRSQIIRTTVDNAIRQGDDRVFFLDMQSALAGMGVQEEASVDLCHPNDLGFFAMAEALKPLLKQCLACDEG